MNIRQWNPYQMMSIDLYQQYEAIDFEKAQTAPVSDSTVWRLITQVNVRDGDGAILEEVDAMGRVSSYLRTVDSRVTSLPYASLEGASFQNAEALYYGGEDYEDRKNWHISGLSVEKNSRLNAGSYLVVKYRRIVNLCARIANKKGRRLYGHFASLWMGGSFENYFEL